MIFDAISDDRCEKAIRYLASTDVEAAEAKVEVKKTEDEIDAIQAAIFHRLEGSVEARKSAAKIDALAVAARNAYYVALLKFESLYNKRKTEERITDLWRSVNSNRRAGIT